jgi:HEAT repeat protein
MKNTMDALVEKLRDGDFNVRAGALAELVRQGAAAAPALRAALPDAVPPARALIAQGLAEISDRESADIYLDLLRDADGTIRARGAQGLARISHPQALEALLQTIDEAEDPLRHPYTLSLHGLIGFGPPALPGLAALLDAPNPLTRERATLALHAIKPTMRAGK